MRLAWRALMEWVGLEAMPALGGLVGLALTALQGLMVSMQAIRAQMVEPADLAAWVDLVERAVRVALAVD